MRILVTGLLSSFIFFSSSAYAIEPVLDQHAMFYYQVPLGASNSHEARHNFGFRFDRTMMQPGEIIQYQSLMRDPAVVDIRMGYDGIRELQLNGIDYVERYYVLNGANAEGTENGNGEGGTTEEKKPGLDELMHSIPTGVLIGGAIGIAILSGATAE
jgi:hypothetical protein